MRLNIDSAEVYSLIEGYFEERLTESDSARLSAIIEQSSEARSLYWEAASIHGLLEHTLQNTSVMVLSGRALSLGYLKKVWFSERTHHSRVSWLSHFFRLPVQYLNKALRRAKDSRRGV